MGKKFFQGRKILSNKKWDLIGAGVFAFVLILIMLFMPKASYSNETNKLNDWFEKQYNEFITYQKEQWQQGKEQLALNKEQIINIPETITNSLSQSYTDMTNYFNSLLNKTNDQ
jgi:hypothetical protein